MSDKKDKGVKKELTEQELQMQAQKLLEAKIAKASGEIKKILIENNLMMYVDHVVKLVPNNRK